MQDPLIVITYRDGGDSQPLQREQFETLIHRVKGAAGSFALDGLPLDADLYATVLTLHPRFDVDGSVRRIRSEVVA